MEDNRLYVGNLAFDSTEEDLRVAFSPHGGVSSVKLVTDRETGRSRGFAFVEMENGAAAQAAISALHETNLGGRAIQVNVAKPRETRSNGGGGGGGGRSRW